MLATSLRRSPSSAMQSFDVALGRVSVWRCLSSQRLPNGEATEPEGILKRLKARSDKLNQWEHEISPALVKVDETVTTAISTLEAFRSDVPMWRSAFQAVQNIAGSSTRNLLRPQLVFLGYAAGKSITSMEALSDPPPGLVRFAAGVELQHLFMFVHDDMMDHALTRRGHDTIQVAIARGEQLSSSDLGELTGKLSPETVQHLTTLIGDTLQAKSAQLLASGEGLCESGDPSNPSAMDAVLEGAFRAGAAQFDDIVGWQGVEHSLHRLQFNASTSPPSMVLLERLMEDKASYHSFAAPLIAGIRLSGKRDATLEKACTDWARHIGAAFQGVDDVIDLVLEVKESGKDRLQDIQEGRLSLPLFLLREKATTDEWNAVYNVLGSHAVLAPSERHMLLKLINKYDLNKASLAFVTGEVRLAREAAANAAIAGDEYAILRQGMDVFVQGLDDVAKQLSAYTD
mmetsp:Transcript_21692/g.38310  ORF Transcript_21692/g.38310 Transcript_21692/m.38310 type:complete len:458 (-) Transcript_21692:227-1600(-)|eukprot:CAMPEP_0184530986 /NCGR_PEP_ID=MMETSP0198_2-20121128/13277_1 /TAXON_ID=1112570 /ORGANISM="Thraustochytrium sp., Strain LLF1b" /LENGTH=457 /DNA_ID=CAMNT_0026923255 /DNA_START=224 /DNA_END=1597 /DNA_ORIENTATION=+